MLGDIIESIIDDINKQYMEQMTEILKNEVYYAQKGNN